MVTSFDGRGVRTVVIDSVNGYRAALPEERSVTLRVHELLLYLNRQGTSTFLPVGSSIAQSASLGDRPQMLATRPSAQ